MTEIVAAINEIKIIGKPKINDNKKKALKLGQFIILSVEIKIKDSNKSLRYKRPIKPNNIPKTDTLKPASRAKQSKQLKYSREDLPRSKPEN